MSPNARCEYSEGECEAETRASTRGVGEAKTKPSCSLGKRLVNTFLEQGVHQIWPLVNTLSQIRNDVHQLGLLEEQLGFLGKAAIA